MSAGAAISSLLLFVVHVDCMGLETVVPRTDAPSAGLVAGQVVRRRFTNIWKKEGDTWRLYWRHANVITSR